MAEYPQNKIGFHGNLIEVALRGDYGIYQVFHKKKVSQSL